jgi:hypothetical protein
MVSPADHPNGSAALIAGYLASALIYGARKAGVTLTPEEAASGAAALIALVLVAAGKATKTP